jgi:tRNA U34 5-methylaminomethyl-2-thiouridine-forming methyltransferase MnmC
MNREFNNELKIVATADGSNTIYNPQVGENYHSRNGALQESRHVFLNAGLRYFLNGNSEIQKIAPSAGGEDFEGAQILVSILEVGFGTGLNFLLSAEFSTEKEIKLDYTGIEAYPLSAEMIGQTGYGQYISSTIWGGFINAYSNALADQVRLGACCTLQIAGQKLQDFQSNRQYDVIYFDAFAVARQPEMWDEAAIRHTLQFLKTGGVFVTYAITGNLKRALKVLGCKVEKAKGAPGKREMLRAIKIA